METINTVPKLEPSDTLTNSPDKQNGTPLDTFPINQSRETPPPSKTKNEIKKVS